MSETAIEPEILFDWQAAERAAVEHMQSIGFADAQLTASGADGGVDVLSTEAAAQVKFYANPVGRPDIQRLRGAAHEYLLSLFYSTGGYTAEAIAYADRAGVGLFVMSPFGRCEPASSVAHELVAPNMVQERRHRLEELQAVRYRYAAAALESDMKLFVEFAAKAQLDPAEKSLYTGVLATLQPAIDEFREAIESKEFARADATFWDIQQRRSFLNWATPSPAEFHSDLEHAIEAGWRLDATPGSAHLLSRIAEGVVELQKVLHHTLQAWEEHLPAGIYLSSIIDPLARRFAGMLEVASLNPSMLTADQMAELLTAVSEGVVRGFSDGLRALSTIERLLTSNGLPSADVVAAQIRAESIVERIDQQLRAARQ